MQLRIPLDIEPKELLRYWSRYLIRRTKVHNAFISNETLLQRQKEYEAAIMKLEGREANKIN